MEGFKKLRHLTNASSPLKLNHSYPIQKANSTRSLDGVRTSNRVLMRFVSLAKLLPCARLTFPEQLLGSRPLPPHKGFPMDGTLAGAGSILNPSLSPFILGPDGMISLNFQAFSPHNAGKFAGLQFVPLYMIYSSIFKNRFLYFKHQEMSIEHRDGEFYRST